jgi:nicotinamide-nucleotide amidase
MIFSGTREGTIFAPMQAILITIGDELLYGKTVDTNATWMAAQLSEIGIVVREKLTISDKMDVIQESVKRSLERADLILMTGGLGPTRDDVTKKALSDYFGTELEDHPEVRANLERLFRKWGREVPDASQHMSLVPRDARIFVNSVGTAAGMWFEQDRRVVISMPGVPHEMKHLMQNHILEALIQHFDRPQVLHRHIMTVGIGESRLAEKIVDLEDALPDHIRLAYLPSTGAVKLRLSASQDISAGLDSELESWVQQFSNRIGKHIYGYDGITLAEALLQRMQKANLSLGISESCTGGRIAARMVRVPGVSAYFHGGVVAYSYEAKEDLLGVPMDLLNEHGAVSTACVDKMLDGTLARFKCDLAVATSGIAGPGGGTPEKPVGTVYIGVHGPMGRKIKRFQFPGNREINTELTVIGALASLIRMLDGNLELST